jgi:hypothetical protein
MDLEKASYKVSMYNFGQPRVGNKAYASYSTMLVPEMYRHINYKDIVPHIPYREIGFYHSAQEVWIDLDGNLHMCSPIDGEDKECSNQFHMWQYSGAYHTLYMGTPLGGGSCEST